MASPYRKIILNQLLDGKLRWLKEELGSNAVVNDFFTQVVTPLRELKAEGIVEISMK